MGVLDFDDEDDGEVALKTPPPSRPIVSRAVTERKPKRTIPNVQAELKVDHLKDLPKYDFVQSLADDIPPWRVDELAKPYPSNFKKEREELTTKLFQIFSDTIFSSRLVPSQIPVTWDTRLLTTAGIKRHSKSVKPGTRCEECLGTFELLVNKKLASGAIVTTPASAQRQAGPFANYVREYYFTVKQKGRPHAEVMKILRRQFALLKSAGLT